MIEYICCTRKEFIDIAGPYVEPNEDFKKVIVVIEDRVLYGTKELE